MKTRIITGVVAAVLFLLVLIQPVNIILDFVIGALCSIACYELLACTGYCPSKIIQIVSMVFAFTVAFWGEFWRLTDNFGIPTLIVLVYCAAIAIIQVIRFDEQPITSSIFAVAMTLWSSFALSTIAYLRDVDGHGLFLTILMLLICWMSDTGAYFVGVLFGSHKLCPEISPKKTVEGFFGGIVTSLIVCGAVTFIYNLSWDNYYSSISLWWVLIIVLFGSVLSVFGDLTASLLKRLCEIKDFGNLLPGHGGVMDRFDSLLLTAPFYFVCMTVFKSFIFISNIACIQ